MSSNGQPDFSYKPKREGSPALPSDNAVPLAANQDASYGQIALLDPSTGNAQLADAQTPNMIGAGTANLAENSTSSTVAGAARLFVSWGCAVGRSGSTVSIDGPTAASVAVPAWVAGPSTYGLLTHTGTVNGANLKNRSIGGLFLGLDPDSPVNGTARPYVWEGPIATTVARAAMIADAYPLAHYTITDAAASTTTAERAIPRAKLHGHVTSIEFIGAAVVTDDTDYAVITVSKRDGAGNGATTLGTYSTKTTGGNGAITAFVPAAFTLSTTSTDLDLLEGDIITVTVTKGGSGKTLTGAIRVNGKAI